MQALCTWALCMPSYCNPCRILPSRDYQPLLQIKKLKFREVNSQRPHKPRSVRLKASLTPPHTLVPKPWSKGLIAFLAYRVLDFTPSLLEYTTRLEI